MDLDRQGALLSKSQREYLTKKSEYEDSHARAIRGRIRSRVKNAILDFRIIDKNLEQRDWEQIFDLDNNPESTPLQVAGGDADREAHNIRLGLVRMIAFIYRISKHSPSIPDFEFLIRNGVAYGEGPQNLSHRPKNVKVTFTVDEISEIDMESVFDKLDEGGPTVLNEDELRAFAHFADRHSDTPRERFREVFEEERKEAAENKGIPVEDVTYRGHIVDRKEEE